jgi:hypothetical protein
MYFAPFWAPLPSETIPFEAHLLTSPWRWSLNTFVVLLVCDNFRYAQYVCAIYVRMYSIYYVHVCMLYIHTVYEYTHSTLYTYVQHNMKVHMYSMYIHTMGVHFTSVIEISPWPVPVDTVSRANTIQWPHQLSLCCPRVSFICRFHCT